jgi:hypothetical protein
MQYDPKSTTGPPTRLVENGGPDHTITRGVLWTMAPAIWAMSDPALLRESLLWSPAEEHCTSEPLAGTLRPHRLCSPKA